MDGILMARGADHSSSPRGGIVPAERAGRLDGLSGCPAAARPDGWCSTVGLPRWGVDHRSGARCRYLEVSVARIDLAPYNSLRTAGGKISGISRVASDSTRLPSF